MVESRQVSGFMMMVNTQTFPVIFHLLPNLTVIELVKFCRLNKRCNKIMQEIVNFKVLFQTKGLKLKLAQEYVL